jgi:hypothetical protein
MDPPKESPNFPARQGLLFGKKEEEIKQKVLSQRNLLIVPTPI